MKYQHAWNVAPKEAIVIQQKMREQVSLVPLNKNITIIAGADVSLERFGTELFAGIVVLSYPDLFQIDYAVANVDVTFPYVPGLLSFREIPGLLQYFEGLKTKPDLIVVDGQGIAHPRHLGIATHLGVLLDTPTIGCAKSLLYGSFKTPQSVGEVNPITDPKTGEQLGVVMKSKARSNPLFISPGHRITVAESTRIIQSCLCGYRLSEPTRHTHLLVNKFRRGELGD